MSKKDLKNMNALYFRWWKEEAEENEKLLKEIAELKAKNFNLKQQIYENQLQARGRAGKEADHPGPED